MLINVVDVSVPQVVLPIAIPMTVMFDMVNMLVLLLLPLLAMLVLLLLPLLAMLVLLMHHLAGDSISCALTGRRLPPESGHGQSCTRRGRRVSRSRISEFPNQADTPSRPGSPALSRPGPGIGDRPERAIPPGE